MSKEEVAMDQSFRGDKPSRRGFLQGGIATLGVMAAASRTSAQTAPSRKKRPNLIFLFGEGQRADALGLAGHPILKTPNHDRIGREGVYFKNSFVTNALCAPARAVAMTGLQSRVTGALTNNTESPIPASIPLFTDLLREAGYEVAFSGKAHIGNGMRERYWDYYSGFNDPSYYYKPQLYEGRNGNVTETVGYERYPEDAMTDRALDWLKQDRDKPFCLLLWFQAPHPPYFRARRHGKLYNGVPIPVPATFDQDLMGYPGKPRVFVESREKIGLWDNACNRSLEEICKDYYAGLVAVDENIGRIFDFLTASGQLEDTAIVHSSDHGYFLGEWHMTDKRLMHEPSIRVPTMIRYPKLFAAGRVVDEMVLNLDIAPTLLELAGVDIPKAMQGRSLVKLAKGEETTWRKDWLYEYYEYPSHHNIRKHRGVRTERYKFIHYYMDPEEFELYDLISDPEEKNNLAANRAYSTLFQTMKTRLQELVKEASA